MNFTVSLYILAYLGKLGKVDLYFFLMTQETNKLQKCMQKSFLQLFSKAKNPSGNSSKTKEKSREK